MPFFIISAGNTKLWARVLLVLKCSLYVTIQSYSSIIWYRHIGKGSGVAMGTCVTHSPRDTELIKLPAYAPLSHFYFRSKQHGSICHWRLALSPRIADCLQRTDKEIWHFRQISQCNNTLRSCYSNYSGRISSDSNKSTDTCCGKLFITRTWKGSNSNTKQCL